MSMKWTREPMKTDIKDEYKFCIVNNLRQIYDDTPLFKTVESAQKFIQTNVLLIDSNATKIFIGEIKKRNLLNYICVPEMLEYAVSLAVDDVGENGYNMLNDLTDEMIEEFENIILNWGEKNNLTPNFIGIDIVGTVDIKKVNYAIPLPAYNYMYDRDYYTDKSI